MKKIACSAVLSLCACLSSFGQGSLTPPAAPGPTMKSLDQIQPRTIINSTNTPGDGSHDFIISAPGSYYLTGNLNIGASASGIQVTATDVTIDLNGFRIARTSGGGEIITVANTATHCKIMNGKLLGNGSASNGIGAASAIEGTLSDVTVQTCQTNGATVGDHWLVHHCQFNDNIGAGGSGLATGNDCIVSECVAYFNGIDGIHTGAGNMVKGCTAHSNYINGISTGTGSTVIDCVATNNSGNNLPNVGGIKVDAGSSVIHCTVSGNTGPNTGTCGIYAGGGYCTIIGCTAVQNTNSGSAALDRGVGIYIAGGGGLVKDCTASNNKGGGIYVNPGIRSQIVDNLCVGNGTGGVGSGIQVDGTGGSGCRIEGNNVAANATFGIYASGGASIVIRNTASANTANNYRSSGTTNAIQCAVAATSPPFAGPSGGTPLGSTDPWINWSY